MLLFGRIVLLSRVVLFGRMEFLGGVVLLGRPGRLDRVVFFRRMVVLGWVAALFGRMVRIGRRYSSDRGCFSTRCYCSDEFYYTTGGFRMCLHQWSYPNRLGFHTSDKSRMDKVVEMLSKPNLNHFGSPAQELCFTFKWKRT